MKVFISYSFDDQAFVKRVHYYLRKQPGIESYCYEACKQWREEVGREIASCEKFILFVGKTLGNTQEFYEAEYFVNNREPLEILQNAVVVTLPDAQILPPSLGQLQAMAMNFVNVLQATHKKGIIDDAVAQKCAKEIAEQERLQGYFIPDDGLPIGYPFDYEKDIIEEFVQGGGRLLRLDRLEEGSPISWPDVIKRQAHKPNPISEDICGNYRPEKERIIVDARSKYHPVDGSCCLAKKGLTFLEAGPRGMLHFPHQNQNTLKVGILVSGGIAPGINAVISGIVQRHHLYNQPRHNLEIRMYSDGFRGLQEGRFRILDQQTVRDQSNLGGSMISTSRYDALLDFENRIGRDKLLQRLALQLAAPGVGVDILYVIGGDGSMRAAHALWTRYENMREDPQQPGVNRKISIVAIPKTMDNDILWVWQSFGFLSAVEKSKEFVLQLHTETSSNPRLCIVQLFGSDSGFVVSHAALASGVCKAALIPEVDFSLNRLSEHIIENLQAQADQNQQQPYGIILLAETAIPRDVEDYIDNPQYPELELEEREKEAIRKFVGSPLLNVNDIKDWSDLCSSLGVQAQGLAQKIRASLPKDVQGMIDKWLASRDSMPDDQGARLGLIVKAFNRILKDKNLRESLDLQYSSLDAEAKKIAEYLDKLIELKNDSNFLSDQDFKRIKDNLKTLHLPYEIKAILEKKTLTRNNIPNDELQILIRRLKEKLNRLVLQACFPSQIKKTLPAIPERRVSGKTPDEMRTGGLKVVSGVLQQDIRRRGTPWSRHCHVFRNEPRHLIRSIPPSVTDVIFGQRLGVLAVDNAMAGYTDFMVSQWMTEYVLVPLKLVVLGRKRVPEKGIFWKSVLANTRQPAKMI